VMITTGILYEQICDDQNTYIHIYFVLLWSTSESAFSATGECQYQI
jgi:hypothetical protein